MVPPESAKVLWRSGLTTRLLDQYQRDFTNMATKYDLNLRDYWRVIRKRKFIIIFTTLAMGVFSFLFSIMQQPVPLYQATASVKVEQSGSITGLYIQSVSWSQTDYMQTQAAMIKSYYIMETAAKRLGLIPPDLPSEKVRASKKHQNIMMDLKKSVETEQEGYSNIINILVTSKDPVFAQRVANTIAQVYKEQHALDLNKRTFEAKKFIENQLTVVKKRLRDSEEAVRKFREENKLISLSAQTSRMLGQMTSLQAIYEKSMSANEKVRKVQKYLEGAKDKPLTSKTSFYINEASSLYKNLNDRLVQLMLKRDSLLLIYTEKYPQVVEINEQIREIVKNMTAQLSSQEKTVTANIISLKKKIDEMDKHIKALPEKGLELGRLEQKVMVNGEVCSLLEKKYQESLIKEAEKLEEVQIVKPALEPVNPINPPKTMATGVVGTLIGLILGIVFGFVVETFDTSIGAIEDVEELTGVNVLGIIPHVSIQDIKATLLDESRGEMDDKTAERYSRIVSHFAPKSTLAESYRALRTNLSFIGVEGDMKALVFTSSSPMEGKSTIVINLAVTMAQAGKKVLLVDGDMRKPMVANVFGIDQAPGLSDVILGNYSLEGVVRSVTDIMTGKISMDDIMKTPGMDNLYIVTSGTLPPNPAEMAGSRKIAELIKQARSEYDIILMDAPPLLSATDAALYGSFVDGVLLVYRVGVVGRAVLKRAKAQLDNVKAKIVGIVLNGLKAEISPDFATQDYYKYSYYYSEGEGKKRPAKSFFGRLLSILSSASDFFKKASKKGPDKKISLVKFGILLITLILLGIAILYQLGYLKLPWFTAASSPSHRSSSFTKGIVTKPVIKKEVSGTKSESSKQQADTIESSVAGKSIVIEEGSSAFKGSGPLKQQVKIDTSGKAEKTISAQMYAIQIGSFRDKEIAKRIASKARSSGLEAFWIEVNKKKSGVWYIVLVGQFGKRSESLKFMREKELAKAYPGSWVFKIPSSHFTE